MTPPPASRELTGNVMLAQSNKPARNTKRLTRKSGLIAKAGSSPRRRRATKSSGLRSQPNQHVAMNKNQSAAQDLAPFVEGAAEDTAVRISPAFVRPSARASSPATPIRGKDTSRREARPVRTEAAANDSTLSKYFRDMATHQVMGPDEELHAAKGVEDAEIDYWIAVLSYLPIADQILECIEKDVLTLSEEARPSLTEVPALRGLLDVYRKQRSKLHAGQQKQWDEFCRSLAKSVRLPDTDRIWVANALAIARGAQSPDSRGYGDQYYHQHRLKCGASIRLHFFKGVDIQAGGAHHSCQHVKLLSRSVRFYWRGICRYPSPISTAAHNTTPQVHQLVAVAASSPQFFGTFTLQRPPFARLNPPAGHGWGLIQRF